jgi:hypothetical protein
MASPLYEVATWAKLTAGQNRKTAKKPIVQDNFEEVLASICMISCCAVVHFKANASLLGLWIAVLRISMSEDSTF